MAGSLSLALRGGSFGVLLVLLLECVACGSSDHGKGGSAGAEAGEGGGGSAGTASGGGSSGGTSANDAGSTGDAGAGLTPALWYAGSSLCRFSADQLLKSGEADPKLLVPIKNLTVVSDVALDADGDVWVVGVGSNSIFRFAKAALNKPTTAKPDLVINSDALSDPATLTFDVNGNLWVGSRPPIKNGRIAEGSLMRFDIPSGSSGTLDLAPAAQLSSATEGDLTQIGSMTFDAAQNLWLSSLVGLVRFDDPTGESGAVVLEPGAVIDKSGYPNNIYFYSVAFDGDGSLWAASGDGLHFLTSLTAFTDPGLLQGRVFPEAAVTIKGGADFLPAGGIAFDGTGNLWAARSDAILRYANPRELSGDVDPKPEITLTVSQHASPSTNSHLLFYPPFGAGAP